VRVAWLGDSHGMADHWSGALRSGLQKRFGDAGPGFVHAGIPHARHDAMKIALDGQFVMKPRGPSTSAVTGDGTFGLGGILAEASGGSRVTLTPTIAPPDTDLTFDVCYKLASPSDQVGIEVGHSPKVIAAVTPTEPEKSLAHMTLSGTAGASITLSPTAGAFLCGVVIETDPTKRPGVVLDTLGINGARYATVLAWNEAAWSAEWKRRAPDLVVLEYGTNELSDIDAKPAVHTRALANVVARIRRTTPDVDCLVLAPTDRLDREAIEPALVTALEDEAQKLGCGFWNTFEKMGGLQSIAKWRSESPPRANRDGIHLNTRGYREMGEKLYADLIAGYTP
jgi:lysophospholipase L1-like esterase